MSEMSECSTRALSFIASLSLHLEKVLKTMERLSIVILSITERLQPVFQELSTVALIRSQ